LNLQESLTLSAAALIAVSDTPILDSRTFLADLLGWTIAQVMAYPEAVLSEEQEKNFETRLRRLAVGEPLPYVLGHQDFFGLEFLVNSAVLIPRPETELLAEKALSWLQDHPDKRRALDVGTGSGIIAISLLRYTPDLRIVATDICWESLMVARKNIQQHLPKGSLQLLQCDLLDGICEKFDLICANLPYIPGETLKKLRVYDWEPEIALNGGVDGLDFIRMLLAAAPGKIASGGLILLEIEATQGTRAFRLAEAVFPHAEIRILPDLSGHDRVVQICIPD